MIKRTAAIVFILLANILLLVNAVVPHHHHHKQVCLVSSHCLNDDIASGNNINRDKHNHDGENDSDDCILKKPVIVLTDQREVEFKFIDNAPDRTIHDEFYDNSSNYTTQFLFTVLSQFVSIHFNNSTYSSLVSASLGLRAPPVV